MKLDQILRDFFVTGLPARSLIELDATTVLLTDSLSRGLDIMDCAKRQANSRPTASPSSPPGHYYSQPFAAPRSHLDPFLTPDWSTRPSSL
jgi:hypothetical protein